MPTSLWWSTVDNQLVLTPSVDAFYSRVTWEQDIAARWRPSSEPGSQVVIDPETRGGRPSVGVSARWRSGNSTKVMPVTRSGTVSEVWNLFGAGNGVETEIGAIGQRGQ